MLFDSGEIDSVWITVLYSTRATKYSNIEYSALNSRFFFSKRILTFLHTTLKQFQKRYLYLISRLFEAGKQIHSQLDQWILPILSFACIQTWESGFMQLACCVDCRDEMCVDDFH